MTMIRFSEKRLLVDVKAKYLLLEIRLLDVKIELGSLLPGRSSIGLGDDLDWLGVGLEAILRIRRLRRSVCGTHMGALDPSSAREKEKIDCFLQASYTKALQPLITVENSSSSYGTLWISASEFILGFGIRQIYISFAGKP